MDNSLSQDIIKSSDTSFPSQTYTSADNGGFFGFIKNISITTWLLIILILAFLGFNIFVYLAKGTQDVTNFFKPILNKLLGATAETTSKTIDVSAEGAKAVVGGTASAIKGGLTAVQEVTPNKAPSNIKGDKLTQEKPDVIQQSDLNKRLEQPRTGNSYYQANEATSSLGGDTGKSGWCYIGQDRGFRSCAKVGADDKCMSGDIFPTKDICMNPSLRV